MFFLDSNDPLIADSVSSILQQKEIIHTLDKKKKYFFKIEIIKNLKDIELRVFSKIIKLEIPISINSLTKKIYNLFSDFTLEINDAKFYPLKQSLVYKDKETYLGNIHYIIFCQLLLHRENGAIKTELYKEIWPQDKEYQFNKLDTHLTNLKNHLKEKINFDFLFSTRSGLIYIRVD